MGKSSCIWQSYRFSSLRQLSLDYLFLLIGVRSSEFITQIGWTSQVMKLIKFSQGFYPISRNAQKRYFPYFFPKILGNQTRHFCAN
jgi:hypothetical protein